MLFAMILCIIFVLTNIATVVGFKTGYIEAGTTKHKDLTMVSHTLVGVQTFAAETNYQGWMYKCSCGTVDHTGKNQYGTEQGALDMFKRHASLWKGYVEETRLELNKGIAKNSVDLNNLLSLDQGLRSVSQFALNEQKRKKSNW